MQSFRILAINPGSTSTKVAIFDNEISSFEKTIRHSREELRKFRRIIDQYAFRKEIIMKTLIEKGINLADVNAVVGRGGLLRPIEGGTYEVNDQMITDLKNGYNGEHASNLGGILAYEIASKFMIPAYIVDPVVVDEMQPIAKVSGFESFNRKSIFHALNQKAVARKVANDFKKNYDELRLIIAHLGGGITVGVHKYGRVIDVNNGLHGEGPFSPERAGTVPAGDLVNLCFSTKLNADEIMNKIVGKGGLSGYLDTNDAQEVERRIASGDSRANLIYDAMAYQVAKEIGACSTVLEGRIDGIVLTGGLAFSQLFVQKIVRRISWIANVIVHPGEDELLALVEGALRVLRKQEMAKTYTI